MRQMLERLYVDHGFCCYDATVIYTSIIGSVYFQSLPVFCCCFFFFFFLLCNDACLHSSQLSCSGVEYVKDKVKFSHSMIWSEYEGSMWSLSTICHSTPLKKLDRGRIEHVIYFGLCFLMLTHDRVGFFLFCFVCFCLSNFWVKNPWA